MNLLKNKDLHKTSTILIIVMILMACLFTASTIDASYKQNAKSTNNVALASARMMEVPEQVAKFDAHAQAVSLKEEVVEEAPENVTYTEADYLMANEAGALTCAENASFSLQNGCVCNVGYNGDGKESCVENPVEQFAYAFDGNGWASVTGDVSGYWSDNAIVNAALSMVGSYGYDCYSIVKMALAANGWSGSVTGGTEVGLNGMVPGDVIVYPSHYAIYVGDGKAVHGGYNGLNVILGDVVVGKQPYTAYHCQ